MLHVHLQMREQHDGFGSGSTLGGGFGLAGKENHMEDHAVKLWILVVSVVAVGFMFRENRNLLTAVQQNGSLVVQVPRNEPKAEASHRLALFDEQLRQVDDGIQEPDREIVTKPGDLEAGRAEEVVPVDTQATGLLSIRKPPRRE